MAWFQGSGRYGSGRLGRVSGIHAQALAGMSAICRSDSRAMAQMRKCAVIAEADIRFARPAAANVAFVARRMTSFAKSAQQISTNFLLHLREMHRSLVLDLREIRCAQESGRWKFGGVPPKRSGLHALACAAAFPNSCKRTAMTMRKMMFFAVSALFCGMAYAQSPGQGGAQGGSNSGAPATPAGGTGYDPVFAATKQMTLQRLGAEIEALQRGLACAKHSRNDVELNQCRKQSQAAAQRGGRSRGLVEGAPKQ